MPRRWGPLAAPDWVTLSTATSPFVHWYYIMVSTSSCRVNPDSHATFDERVAFWQAAEASKERETRRKHGRVTAIPLYR
jgi:hypothetical protein